MTDIHSVFRDGYFLCHQNCLRRAGLPKLMMMIVLRKIINDDNDNTDTEFDYIDKLSSNLLWRQVDTICL